jgi:hypothetical protein
MKSLVDHDGQKIEAMLTPLIAEHGLPTVQEHLQALIPRSRWADYQRLWNIAGNIGKRLTKQQTQRV